MGDKGKTFRALVLGRSDYGKSFLVKIFLRDAKERGVPTGVLDILAEDDWDVDFQTDDPEHFLAVFWDSEGAVWAVDEGGEVAGRASESMKWTATRGKHNGHSVYYLAHRLNVLDTTLRAQCTSIFLFASSGKDARDLADEFGDDRLAQASSLDIGEFYHLAPGKKAKKYKIDFENRKILEVE